MFYSGKCPNWKMTHCVTVSFSDLGISHGKNVFQKQTIKKLNLVNIIPNSTEHLKKDNALYLP